MLSVDQRRVMETKNEAKAPNGGVVSPVRKNFYSILMVAFKRHLDELLARVASRETFRVRVENQANYNNEVRQIISEIKSLQILLREPFKVKVEDRSHLIAEEISKDFSKLDNQLSTLLVGLAHISEKIKLEVPKVQKVTGEISLSHLPDSYQLDNILDKLSEIKLAIAKIKLESPTISLPPQKEIKIPPFPKVIETAEGKEIIKAVEKLSDRLKDLPKKISPPKFPNHISVDNFPPQKYPMPVTHISINSLKGYVKTTAVTVTSALTPLPSEVLSNRRSLVLYNNAASTTIEVGGSTFTFGNGMPIKAGNYSPAFDAGVDMIVYGRTSSGSADVRVIEMSDEMTGR